MIGFAGDCVLDGDLLTGLTGVVWWVFGFCFWVVCMYCYFRFGAWGACVFYVCLDGGLCGLV